MNKCPFFQFKELRKHIIRSIISIIICTIFLLINKNFIFDHIIFYPAKYNFIFYIFLYKINFIFNNKTLPNNIIIQNNKFFGQFNTYVFVSLIGGFILSFPYICYEFWKFIKPGLYKEERKKIKKIYIISLILFILGLIFGYFILSPFGIQFADTFLISNLPKNIFDLNEYVSIIIESTFLMGFFFIFPIIPYILKKLNIINSLFLKKYRKHAFFFIIYNSLAITTGDIITTIIVFIPLYSLYEISILTSILYK